MRRGGQDGDASRSSRLASLLRQFDTNGDGTIPPDEVNISRRSVYEGVVRRAGLDPSGPVSVQSLAEALSQRGGRGASASSSSASQSGTTDSTAAQASLVPGFGVAVAQTAMVPGFGGPATVKTVSTSGTAPSSTSTSSLSPPPSSGPSSPPSPSSGPPDRPQIDSKFRRYAESLMRQYDKNKNGVLEKDEWMQMRGTWHDADTNGDGTITLDELAGKLGQYSGRGSSSSSTSSSSGSPQPSSSGASSGSSGPPPSAGRDTSARKTYRFLSPQERLPQGLPEWFVRKDADGDGQVTMAEYSHTWSNSLAEEFARYDRNGDGVVTPEEAIKSQGSR